MEESVKERGRERVKEGNGEREREKILKNSLQCE